MMTDDPDRVDEDTLPALDDAKIMALAEVDLAIAEIIRQLDDAVDEWVDPIDRTLVLHCLRMAWIQGYEDRHNDSA